MKNKCARFYASAAKYMRYALFWGTAQRTVVIPADVSGQPNCPIFKFQEIQKNTSRNVGKDLPIYAV
jgi:hypothetical protein